MLAALLSGTTCNGNKRIPQMIQNRLSMLLYSSRTPPMTVAADDSEHGCIGSGGTVHVSHACILCMVT